ncbi:hypothetical protein RY27_17125 [Litorilinea aerophila]|nr:hypothetical protein RY27_17125 [Litorilinea aerophila]
MAQLGAAGQEVLPGIHHHQQVQGGEEIPMPGRIGAEEDHPLHLGHLAQLPQDLLQGFLQAGDVCCALFSQMGVRVHG